MTRRCDSCGREGTRGFWTQVRLWPLPNRTLCTTSRVCEKRSLAAAAAKATGGDADGPATALPVVHFDTQEGGERHAEHHSR